MASSNVPYRAFLEPRNRQVDSYVRVETCSDGADLKIADCNQTIELDFHYYAQTPKQRLRKLAKLEKALAVIREHLEAQIDSS